MKLNFFNVLVGGVVMVTVGMMIVLWTNDSRIAGSASRKPERLALQSPSRSKAAFSPRALQKVEPEKERSILPIGRRHPKMEDFERMDLPQRVQVHQQRRNEFMRERMASLAAQVSND